MRDSKQKGQDGRTGRARARARARAIEEQQVRKEEAGKEEAGTFADGRPSTVLAVVSLSPMVADGRPPTVLAAVRLLAVAAKEGPLLAPDLTSLVAARREALALKAWIHHFLLLLLLLLLVLLDTDHINHLNVIVTPL